MMIDYRWYWKKKIKKYKSKNDVYKPHLKVLFYFIFIFSLWLTDTNADKTLIHTDCIEYCWERKIYFCNSWVKFSFSWQIINLSNNEYYHPLIIVITDLFEPLGCFMYRYVIWMNYVLTMESFKLTIRWKKKRKRTNW